MSKPWEQPAFLNDMSPIEGPQPTGLDGLLFVVSRIRKADEWRRNRWKKDHPGNAAEIDSVIDTRLIKLHDIEKSIENFRIMVGGDKDQEDVACALIRVGFELNAAMHSWTLHAAENGVSQEEGRINAAKQKTVSADEWAERKQRAMNAMFNAGDNKAKAARELGISKSTLENWLRGGRR